MTRDIIIKKFNSPSAFLEWASNEPTPWKGALSSRKKTNTEWSGTKSYEDAYALARYGWPEGIKRLAAQVEIAAKLSPQTPNKQLRYDVAGIRPHPARAAAGEPFSMATRGKNFKQKPIIKIRANYIFSSGTSTETVTRWGAAVCSYINYLGKAGFSVQLDNFMEVPHGYYGGPDLSFQFPLKQAGQPLSLASVVFWWSHPSALRRIGFSAIERLDIENYYSDGYGGSVDPVPIIIKPEPDVLLLTVDDARTTMEKCLDVIREKHLQLLKQNPNPALSLITEKPRVR